VQENELEKEMDHTARLEVCQQELVRGVACEVKEMVRQCVAEEKMVREGVSTAVMEEVCQQVVGHVVQQECRYV